MKITYFFIFVLMGAIALALFTGDTPWWIVWEEAKNRMAGISSEWNPLIDDRLPRLIVLLCSGASLAVSGAVMQALFHNPLAAPSILGITAGGSLLAVIAFALGLSVYIPFIIPVSTVIGCLLTLLIVYFLAKQRGSALSTHSLVLTGIALATLLTAAENSITYALRDQWHFIQMITEWQAGSTHERNWQHVHMQLPLTIVGLLGCLVYRKELNLLALGDEEALNLGVEVNRVRWRLFLCISLLTGATLAAAGNIAFLGLVLPHLIRHFTGPDNSKLIPLCLLSGAATLTFLDQLLRFFSIYSLSIGNIFALFGGICFLSLLLSNKQSKVRISRIIKL